MVKEDKGGKGAQDVAKGFVSPLEPKAKVKVKKAPVEPKAKVRGFSADLAAYLTAWRTDKTTWKFNKVLQAWALESCFNKDLIDKNLFHDLLPYIGTVMGGAKERLIERAQSLIDSEVAESENTGVKRARKVLDKLTKQQQHEGDRKSASRKSDDEA
jgi:hypothetical protein